MKVTANNKHNNPRTDRTFALLIRDCLLNIFGLSCSVDQRKSKLRIFRIIVTNLLFGALAMFLLYFKINKMKFIKINISIKITDTIQSVYDYCQYTIDLFYVYKYGGVTYREYFKQYAVIDKMLGKGRCSKTINGMQAQLTGLFIVIWLASSACDVAAWVSNYGWIIPLVHTLGYIFLLIKILTSLDFISQVVQIQWRIRAICDVVQDYYVSTKCLPGMECDIIQNKNWFYSINVDDAESGFLPKESKVDRNDYNKVKSLSRCYILLTEQCTFINQMFGIRILLNSLSLLIDMVKFTNLAIRMIIEPQHILLSVSYFPIASTIVRLLTCVLILVSLVVCCENAYRQNDKIIFIIDHLLINKNPSTELRASMSELRGLGQARPVNFHLANFFRVDYSLLVSTASVVATYTIILLQSVN